MAEYQLGVIGAGNMAEAVLRGAISSNFVDHNAVVASDPVFERRQAFTRDLGVTTVAENATPAGCPRVLLAVKPQVMAAVLEEIAAIVRPDSTVISIAAGIRTEFIASRLGRRGHVVRVMPNTPMLVGAGASALCKGPGATGADLAWAERLFAVCGQTVRVAEEMMDAVTAVSGSGPAYFFFLVEAMIAAGVAEGLAPEVAAQLAIHTCRGAGEMLARTGERPEVLRAKVTSPGGTTQAAMESLASAKVKEALVAAIRRAAQRSRELGK
jgi:pyrroline-5-carboxylate reductase